VAAEPAAKPEPVATQPPAPKPAPTPEPAPQPKSSAKADADRAQALLNGQPVAKADEARVVVQVGAFAEAEAVRQTRAKLDKLGLKSYTQVVDVGGAPRTRVRVGPFSNRAEADKAAARIKAAGLPAAILSL
jgi:DedD protein